MKVGIYTLGCKVNTYESEYVMSLFKEKGYTISDFDDECDIYIINTCSVTNQSDSKSRKIINQAIRKNPHACIVAMGCFIEANKDIKIDGVDILIGNKDKSKVVELVEDYFKTKKQIVNLYQDLGNDFENMEIKNLDFSTIKLSKRPVLFSIITSIIFPIFFPSFTLITSLFCKSDKRIFSPILIYEKENHLTIDFLVLLLVHFFKRYKYYIIYNHTYNIIFLI